jgi:hypothetical protein
MKLLILVLDPQTPIRVPSGDVLVVAPALNSRLRRWVSDEDAARRRAEERAAALVDGLRRRGVHADGRAGDADPLLAIADALATFAPDAIVIAAGGADELVRRARRRFALPVVLAGESLQLAA